MLQALWQRLRLLPATLLQVSKLLGWPVWFLVLFLNWCRAQFLSPVGEWWNTTVLGTVEESVTSFVRESFTKATSAVNSLFAGLVSLFVDKSYAQVRRRRVTTVCLLALCFSTAMAWWPLHSAELVTCWHCLFQQW